MDHLNKEVPAYEIAKFARKAFDATRKKAHELKNLYLSKGVNQQSVRKAVSEIEPDLIMGSRNANDLANIAHQSQWGDVPVTKEELHHLVPNDDANGHTSR